MREGKAGKQDSQYLYLAERKNPLSNSSKYVYYHVSEHEINGIFPYDGISMEYLCGYVDGATTLHWDKLKVLNGIPEKYHSNWRFEVMLLSIKSLDEILDKTTLSMHYPEFILS